MPTRRDVYVDGGQVEAVDPPLSDVPRKDPQDAVPGDTLVEALPDGHRRRHQIIRLERRTGRETGPPRLVFEPIPSAVTFLTPDEIRQEGRVVVENAGQNPGGLS